ncbi:hypothetical protein NQZ68_026429 [Dissostichus eleginoides]|nr:hypothetical protein NQZ68_026429 [Dissostichus eleginoides]
MESAWKEGIRNSLASRASHLAVAFTHRPHGAWKVRGRAASLPPAWKGEFAPRALRSGLNVLRVRAGACFCLYCTAIAEACVHLYCAAVVRRILPQTSRREGAAPLFSGWGLLSTCPVSAVAEACFHLSCAAVLRSSYPGDIAERRSGSTFGLGPAFHLSCFCCSGGLPPPVVCCCAEEDFTPGTSRRDRSASTLGLGTAFA